MVVPSRFGHDKGPCRFGRGRWWAPASAGKLVGRDGSQRLEAALPRGSDEGDWETRSAFAPWWDACRLQ